MNAMVLRMMVGFQLVLYSSLITINILYRLVLWLYFIQCNMRIASDISISILASLVSYGFS